MTIQDILKAVYYILYTDFTALPLMEANWWLEEVSTETWNK